MNISIGSWSFIYGEYLNKPWSIEKVLKYASAVGFDGVELAGQQPHPDFLYYNTEKKCDQLRRLFDKYELRISGYNANFSNYAPCLTNTKTYINEFKKALLFCKRMNIPMIRLDTVIPPFDMPKHIFEKCKKQLVVTWKKASQLASESNILLTWEFEPGFWLNKTSEVLEILERVNDTNFKIIFDLSHAYMCATIGARHTNRKEILLGGINQLINCLGKHIGEIHLINSDGTLHDDITSSHVPFDKGLINIQEILKSLKIPLNNSEWVCLDYCYCSNVETEAVIGLKYIRALLNQMGINVSFKDE